MEKEQDIPGSLLSCWGNRVRVAVISSSTLKMLPVALATVAWEVVKMLAGVCCRTFGGVAVFRSS